MSDDITIRVAVAGDLAGWVECGVGLFAEDAGTRDPSMNLDWPRVHGPDAFASGLVDDARLIVVAESAGVVVGTLNGIVEPGSAVRPIAVATLRSMYVKPEHRSGGVGARLVARFRDWARERGAVRVAVTAYAANEAALRFYRRQGLVPFHVTLEADA